MSAVAEHIIASQPRSSLVFICPSSSLSVSQAVKQLHELGVDAKALHEVADYLCVHALGWKKGAKYDLEADMGCNSFAASTWPNRLDTSSSLKSRHQILSRRFSGKRSGKEETNDQKDEENTEEVGDDNERSPVIVTFEAMARGLHFDAVETVFIVGRPANHKMYLHLAGRTGRYPVLEGNVVTICTKGDSDHLRSWKRQLGGIEFKLLEAGSSGNECNNTNSAGRRVSKSDISDEDD
eukprot:jgi/Bigna1/76316/fgenesh1_pg.40_\